MSRKKQGGGKRRKALDHDEPFRMCVACRTSRPREAMLRFVRDPGGAVAFDVRAKLPGRGAWTCADPKCVEKAFAKGGFQRAFEEPIVGVESAQFLAMLVGILEGEAKAGLGLLRKAGTLAAGRDDVARCVAEGTAKTLVLARDLSERTRDDVKRHALPEVTGPSQAAIGAAIGRKPTGVLAVLAGPRGSILVADLKRLQNFVATPLAEAPQPS